MGGSERVAWRKDNHTGKPGFRVAGYVLKVHRRE
jgi:hypothetical protein